MLYFIYGVFIISFVTDHINQSIDYCHSLIESKYFINGTMIKNATSEELIPVPHRLVDSKPLDANDITNMVKNRVQHVK